MISQRTIQLVRERSSISDVVSESVPLKRQGSGMVGLCPFHSERSPSFHVHEDDGYYHCFGCGASGNVISFVMETRGLSFPEAVEYLAGRAGIEIEQEKGSRPPKRGSDISKEIFEMNREALLYFRGLLRQAPKTVSDYVAQRELSPEALETFQVGFVSRERRGLLNHLTQKGFSEEKQLISGLIRRTETGEAYDTFRGRLIFPIFLDSRRIAGFGGRVIPGLFDTDILERTPKYINSPETPVYEKSKVLFGLTQAFRAIREEGSVYVVEGYLDVVSMSQRGVTNVLATCGTALTEEHMKRLSRLAKKVILLFDGDSAGRNAAGRTFITSLNSEVDVWALFLAETEDPDTIARTHGTKTQEYLNAQPRKPLIECYIESLTRQHHCERVADLGAAALDKVAREVVSAINKVQKPIIRDRLIEAAAFRLRLKVEILESLSKELRSGKAERAEAVAPQPQPEKPEVLQPKRDFPPIPEISRLDQEILTCVMVHKEQLVGRVLHDATLCESLDPSTLRFIEGLAERLRLEDDEERKKERIKELLKRCGDTWIAHWKRAYSLSQQQEVNLLGSFEQCVMQVRRGRIARAIDQLDTRLRAANDENEQILMYQERLRLLRRLKDLGANSEPS